MKVFRDVFESMRHEDNGRLEGEFELGEGLLVKYEGWIEHHSFQDRETGFWIEDHRHACVYLEFFEVDEEEGTEESIGIDSKLTELANEILNEREEP